MDGDFFSCQIAVHGSGIAMICMVSAVYTQDMVAMRQRRNGALEPDFQSVDVVALKSDRVSLSRDDTFIDRFRSLEIGDSFFKQSNSFRLGFELGVECSILRHHFSFEFSFLRRHFRFSDELFTFFATSGHSFERIEVSVK